MKRIHNNLIVSIKIRDISEITRNKKKCPCRFSELNRNLIFIFMTLFPRLHQTTIICIRLAAVFRNLLVLQLPERSPLKLFSTFTFYRGAFLNRSEIFSIKSIVNLYYVERIWNVLLILTLFISHFALRLKVKSKGKVESYCRKCSDYVIRF